MSGDVILPASSVHALSLVKQCSKPLREQLPAEFSSHWASMSITPHHKGISGTSDDLSQIRIALIGFFLNRLRSLANEDVKRDPDECAFLNEEFALSPTKSSTKECGAEPNETDGDCKKRHFGEICIVLGAEVDPLVRRYHVVPQPVVSLETKKKADCLCYRDFIGSVRRSFYADREQSRCDPETDDKILDAALKFAMLGTPWKTSLKVTVEPGRRRCLEAGSWVLYNAVRLASIKRSYEERVDTGQYQRLDSLDDLDSSVYDERDLSLLMECARLPRVVAEILVVGGGIRTHWLMNYLVTLANAVSNYYRNVRILKEPLPHLLKGIQARGYLVMAANNQLIEGLSLFDIRIPVRM